DQVGGGHPQRPRHRRPGRPIADEQCRDQAEQDEPADREEPEPNPEAARATHRIAAGLSPCPPVAIPLVAWSLLRRVPPRRRRHAHPPAPPATSSSRYATPRAISWRRSTPRHRTAPR